MRHKRIAFSAFFAIGIGLLVLLVSVPYASAQGMEPDVSAALLKEIRQLRVEMAGLQAEVSKLRAMLAGKPSKAEGQAEATETSLQPKRVMIEFTEVAADEAGPGSQGNIAGRVAGLKDTVDYKLVIYSHTDWWYVQPLISDPLTSIEADGKWSTWTHLGHRYAALVVRPSYRPPEKIQSLPAVGADVLAVAEVPAGSK